MSEADRTAAETVRPLVRVRQVREFTAEPVTAEELAAIADAGRWSGSSMNTQPWRLVTIRDAATIKRLADSSMPNTRSLQTAVAAVAVVMPEDPAQVVRHAYDEGRLVERMLIAAYLLGLAGGIAWVTLGNRPAVGEILGLPEGRHVHTILALGHPTESALAPKNEPGKARLPRNEVVFEERWPTE
jgi:nitroreductase